MSPHQHVIMEEEDDDGEPPEYIEPLGAALAQLGQKKGSNKAQMGFTNPAFSTTDLWWMCRRVTSDGHMLLSGPPNTVLFDIFKNPSLLTDDNLLLMVSTRFIQLIMWHWNNTYAHMENMLCCSLQLDEKIYVSLNIKLH